jgi:hypothetical protein
MHAGAEPNKSSAVRGLLLGVLGSLLVHALVLVGLRWAGTLPDVDFELTLPSEVEFGVTHSESVEQPPPAQPAQPAQPPAQQQAAAATASTEAAKPKPKPRPKPKPAADAGVADATDTHEPVSKPTPSGTGDKPLLSAFAPEGAQIALRVNLARVRDSELAPDVRTLLEAIPDFHMILDGSGLDPLRDLERLYLASPDLRRTHLVMAGEYQGGVETAERAVASLAAARGLEAAWSERGAIRVAPWHDLDATDRVLALIAPQQFAITRSDDLERVLQVAEALAQRKPTRGSRKKPASAADALLALAPDEALALSVEGARLFARGNLRGVPERLEASVRMLEDGTLDVDLRGEFESADAAETAAAYWERNRARFADHPLVAFLGMRAPLADATVRSDEQSVVAHTHVGVQQARVVLGFITNALTPPPPPPDAAPQVPAPGSAAAPPQQALPAQPDRATESGSLSRPGP